MTKTYCVECKDNKGAVKFKFEDLPVEVDLIRHIIDTLAFEHASVIAIASDGGKLIGKRHGCQIRRINPPDLDLPFIVIKNTKSLKSAVEFLKGCDNGFYNVITERGVIHCYMKSDFNLRELRGNRITSVGSNRN